MTERRLTPRTKLNQIAYVNLQPGNGGIMLDASAAGIGFQAAGRIDANAPMRFQSSAWSIHETEIFSELVWLDAAGKRGGLRFVDASAEVREAIRVWLGELGLRWAHLDEPAPLIQPNISLPKAESVMPPASADDFGDRSVTFSEASSMTEMNVTEAPEVSSSPSDNVETAGFADAAPQHSTFKLHDESRAASSPESAGILGSFPVTDNAPEPKSRVLLGALTVAVLLSVAGVFFYLGHALERLTGQRAERTSPSAFSQEPSKNNVQPVVNPDKQPSQPVSPPDVIDANEPVPLPSKKPESQGPEAGVPIAGTAPPRDTGQVELERARQYLQEGKEGDRAAAIPLLWAAVGKGNVEAEIELAALYSSGQGMPAKNCEQARILLRAAQANNSTIAAQKLAELSSAGCE
jgi:hypothetical protein